MALLAFLGLLVLAGALLLAALLRGWSPGRLLFLAFGLFTGAVIGGSPGLFLLYLELGRAMAAHTDADPTRTAAFGALTLVGLALGALGGTTASELAFGTRPRAPHVAGVILGVSLACAAIWWFLLQMAHARGVLFALAPVLVVLLGLAGFTLGSPRPRLFNRDGGRV